MKRKTLALLLVFVMALSLFTISAAAADDVSDLNNEGVHLLAERTRKEVCVRAFVTDGKFSSTNGRFVVTYNSDMVVLNSTVANGDWVTSVNANTDGEVSFAWVGSKLDSKPQLALTLYFTARTGAPITFEVEVEELYASGKAVELAQMKDTATTVNREDPVYPVVPVPDDPSKPADKPTTPDKPVESPLPFTDVKGHWASEYIEKVYEAGLMNGVSDTQFAPSAQLTRGMFVTLIYRLAGSPTVDRTMPFTDVGSTWYTDAVAWGYKNGVVNGITETEFRPNQALTRQEMITMLYRYAGKPAASTDSLNAYADAASVADWAKDAMSWSVVEDIINGADGQLSPAAYTSRAQAAAVFCRFAGL